MLPGRLVLLGHPVAHSLSPLFQNAALRAARLPLTYAALDVAPPALADTMRGLAAQRGAGNVTVPHKEAVATMCDRRSAIAERAGAVNCFWWDDGALVGDNTDVGGIDAAVRALLGGAPANLRIAVVGAGGAAAAVLTALEQWPGCNAALWSRSPPRARDLCARFATVAHAEPVLAEAIRDADLVINATPIGLADDGIPFPPALVRRRTHLLDLVYRPGETTWVQLARARRMNAGDGLVMLVEQGALAFERWTGVVPDRRVMWEAATSVAGSRLHAPAAVLAASS